jgi:phytoene dehydrogenase-like protein
LKILHATHAWYSVEQNINDSFYVLVDSTYHITHITPGNYTGDTFATALQTELNNMIANIFTVTYNTSQNNIKIAVVGSHTFKILTDEDAKCSWIFNNDNKQHFTKQNRIIPNIFIIKSICIRFY